THFEQPSNHQDDPSHVHVLSVTIGVVPEMDWSGEVVLTSVVVDPPYLAPRHDLGKSFSRPPRRPQERSRLRTSINAKPSKVRPPQCRGLLACVASAVRPIPQPQSVGRASAST